MVINHPPIPWGFTNASAAAATLNQLPKGSITYVYANMKADPALVDELAAALEPHVMLLGHRTLIRVARMARASSVETRRSALVRASRFAGRAESRAEPEWRGGAGAHRMSVEP